MVKNTQFVFAATLVVALSLGVSAFAQSATTVPSATSTVPVMLTPGEVNVYVPMPTETQHSQSGTYMPEGEKDKAVKHCGGAENVNWNGGQGGWTCFSQQPPMPQNNYNQEPSMMNGGNQGMNMSAKDTERMAKQLASEKKRFASDMGQKQTVQMIEKSKNKLPAGYSVPADISAALAKIVEINQKAQAATDNDTLNDLRSELMEALDVARQGQWQLESISQFPKMEKQANSELSKLTKKLDSLVKSLAKNNIDAGGLVQSARAAIDASRGVLSTVLQDAKSGKIEEAQMGFGDFFEGLGDTWQSVGMLEVVSTATKALASVDKNITAAKSKIISVGKKQGADVSDLLDMLQQAQATVTELKTAVKSSDFDPEDAFSTFMDLNDLRSEIEDGLAEINDGVLVNINFFPMGMGKMPTMDFGKGGPQGGPGMDGPGMKGQMGGGSMGGPGMGGPGMGGPGMMMGPQGGSGFGGPQGGSGMGGSMMPPMGGNFGGSMGGPGMMMGPQGGSGFGGPMNGPMMNGPMGGGSMGGPGMGGPGMMMGPQGGSGFGGPMNGPMMNGPMMMPPAGGFGPMPQQGGMMPQGGGFGGNF